MSANGDLEIYNISDPTRIFRVSKLATHNQMGLICIKKEIAYISKPEGGLLIIDISNVKSPKMIKKIVINSYSRFIVLYDNYLAVGTGKGTHFYDISKPKVPRLIKIYSEFPGDICRKNNTLIITSGKAGTNILDISKYNHLKYLAVLVSISIK